MNLAKNRNTPASRFGAEAGRVEACSPRFPLKIHALRAGLVVLLAACGNGGEEGPSLRIRVAPTPPAMGTARILVQVGGDVAPASGSVTGRPLPDGVGVSLEAGVSGPATVSVPEFAFTRSGPWRLVAEVRLADGSVLRDSTDVRVVEGLSPAPDPPES